MTSITPTTSNLGAVSAPVAASSKTGSISSDFNTFLTLLTAQLKNQDPMDPMDPSKFTEQLTQLSQLEQSAAQTESLETITGVVNGLSARMDAGMLGTKIEIASDAMALVDGAARVDFVLDNAAESVVVDVLDASGSVVAQLQTSGEAGARRVEWDGRNDQSVLMADGVYTARIRALSGTTETSVSALTVGTVQEVRFAADGVYALLDTGLWTPLSGARALGL